MSRTHQRLLPPALYVVTGLFFALYIAYRLLGGAAP